MLKSVDLNYIKKTHWYRQGGAGRIFYYYVPFFSLMFLIGRKNVIIEQKKLLHHGFINKDEELKIAQKDLYSHLQDGVYLKKMIKKWRLRGKSLEKFSKSADFSRLDKLSDNNLVYLYKKFTQLDFNLWKLGIRIELFDPWAEQLIAQEIKKNNLSFPPQEIKILIAPNKITFIQREELSLLHIAGIKNLQKRQKQLLKHQKDFYWLNNDWAFCRKLPLSYFKKRLDRILKMRENGLKTKLGKISQYSRLIKRKKNLIVKKYRMSVKLQRVFDFFSYLTDWRDERKNFVLINNNYYYLFAEEFSRRTSVNLESIFYLAREEVLSTRLRFSKEFKKELKARTQKSIYYSTRSGKLLVLSSRHFDEFTKVLNRTFSRQFSELSGTTGSSGIARGKVKIINTSKDFFKFKTGDILVAPMTRPEYMPLIKKAAAIITDEGGVTCHAAIISRELNKPCVIGVQVATEVLKDGDSVEVDANKGIVKIIKTFKQ